MKPNRLLVGALGVAVCLGTISACSKADKPKKAAAGENGDATDQKQPKRGKKAARAEITSKLDIVNAVKAANQSLEAPGLPLEVELVSDAEQPYFQVDLLFGETMINVKVSAADLTVLATEKAELSEGEKERTQLLMEIPRRERIGLVKALKKAVGTREDAIPIEADLELDDGALVYDIKLLVGEERAKERAKVRVAK